MHQLQLVLPVVIGALGTIPKRLVKRLEDLEITGRVETIQTTALLRLAKILKKKSRGLEVTYCHTNSCEKPSANAGVKNSQKSKIMKEEQEQEQEEQEQEPLGKIGAPLGTVQETEILH